mgnify:FL=1
MVFVIFSESHSFLSYSVVILTDVLPQKLLQPGLAQHPDALLPQKPGSNAPARRQRAGERAFEALRMDVYSRADFIVSDADGEFYCLEMNALPGMTAASLLPKAAKAAGYEYSELCEAIIQESMKARY